MFAEDLSEDFSEDRRYHIYWIFEIFAEDSFLLRSFRKFLPSGFLPLRRFQGWAIDLGCRFAILSFLCAIEVALGPN